MLPAVPVAVIVIGAVILSVKPAATLNVTPPDPTPNKFKSVTQLRL